MYRKKHLVLPFLLPGAASIARFIVLSVVMSLVSGAAAAALSAYRISRIDTGVILRGDN